MDTGVIRSVERAEIIRDGLLRRQDMSKALKAGTGKAVRQCSRPGDKGVLLGPQTWTKSKASSLG